MKCSLLVLAAAAWAEMEDVYMPNYHSLCESGAACVAWDAIGAAANATEQSRVDSYFRDAVLTTNACAFPGRSAGAAECDGCASERRNRFVFFEMRPAADWIAADWIAPKRERAGHNDTVFNSFSAPWCYCPDQGETYCEAPLGVPEQINLQIAASDVVVASFVTFDAVWPPVGAPSAVLNGTALQGVSHPYPHLTAEEGRNYTLHFVPFRNLEPRAAYAAAREELPSATLGRLPSRGVDYPGLVFPGTRTRSRAAPGSGPPSSRSARRTRRARRGWRRSATWVTPAGRP